MMLNGVTVLCLAEQFPGPFATMLLADLGAEVILVERFPGGDPSRQHAEYFASMGRNKRSILLDLKSEAGHAAFMALARTADVILEGYRPGTVERLRVGYDAVRAVNPSIIYASISAFGQDGPYATWPGHDISAQGVAGALSYVYAGGEGAEDRNPSLVAGDLSSAMFTVIGVLAALLERQQSGRGEYLDVAMSDCVTALMTPGLLPATDAASMEDVPGNLSVTSDEPGYGIFRAADGRCVTISLAYEDQFWDRLCCVVGLPDLIGIRTAERRERAGELRAALKQTIARQPGAYWVDLFAAQGIPAGPVLALEEVSADPHVRARGMFSRVAGRLALGLPMRFTSIDRGSVRRGVPALGEHTREVLTEAGVDGHIIATVLDRMPVPPPRSVVEVVDHA